MTVVTLRTGAERRADSSNSRVSSTASDHLPDHPDGTPGGIRLLEADPSLGEGLSPEHLTQVQRYAKVPAVHLEEGLWSLDELAEAAGVHGRVRGFLVFAGCVTMSVELGERTCLRLLTCGEVVLLDGMETDSLPLRWGWSAIGDVSLALFDDRLMVIGNRWPALLSNVLQRAAQQTRHSLLQQAISQLPRVEDRLLALFWTVADRNGTVRADGIWVELPITHETLAQMVGARRPTISLGLRHLEEAGQLRAEPGGWLLDHASIERFRDPPVAAR